MTKRINARLDEASVARLEFLRRRTKQTTTAVVHAALELYYERVKNAGAAPAKRLAETGFIGCISGPTDLSESYKARLAESLSQKGGG